MINEDICFILKQHLSLLTLNCKMYVAVKDVYHLLTECISGT